MSGLNTVLKAAAECTLADLHHAISLIKLKKYIGDYLLALENIRQYGPDDGKLNEAMSQRLAGELHGRAVALNLSLEEERQLWQDFLAPMNASIGTFGSWNTTGSFRGFHPSDTLFATKGDVFSLRNSFNHEFEAVD